jgi:hypothetical protein
MADGDPVLLGRVNTEVADQTTIQRSNGLGLLVSSANGAIVGLTQGGDVAIQGTTANGVGVRGSSVSLGGEIGPPIPGGDGDGVVGESQTRRGVAGFSNSGVGVVGISASSGQVSAGIGTLGSAAPGIGVLGLSSRGIHLVLPRGIDIGVLAYSPAGTGVSARSDAGVAGEFWGPVVVHGNLTVTGAKSAAVPHPDGSTRQLYSIESPESWFEDFGESRIEGSRAIVMLDPDFAVLVETADYQVFLTSYDPVQLYVSNRRPESFEVRVTPGTGGEGQVAPGEVLARFGYRVVARRNDIRPERLERVRLGEEPLEEATAPSNFDRMFERPPVPELVEVEGEGSGQAT